MSRNDDERFRVRPGAPKSRHQKFISKVIKEISKAGGRTLRDSAARPGARLGRGHAAARFTAGNLHPRSRRVTIKTRLVNLKRADPNSTATHLRYIEREGVGRDGEPGKAYGQISEDADLAAFRKRVQGDRHQFRFIVSPEDAEQLVDLRGYTRQLMKRLESDLGTNLDWVAVDHWNTDNAHTHIVLRGKDDTGKDLIISGDYIAKGMRERACELATQWLGPRTEMEIQQSLRREITQERWTSLDRALQREAQGGMLHIDRPANNQTVRRQRQLLVGRLQYLQRLGLAHEKAPAVWAINPQAESVLRSMGERGDIVRTMQRAMGGAHRELAVFEAGDATRPVIGRVAAKGLADELYDRGYLVIDGIDGKAHYIALPAKTQLEQYPVGAIAQVRGSAQLRAVDKNIASIAVNGLYRTDNHLAAINAQSTPTQDPQETVVAHVRRLEALRRAGIVERVTDGVWRVPPDLPERGRQYDTQRVGGASVDLRSHLSIERQARVIGATWLDQQLVSDAAGVVDTGFGSEVRSALRTRADFLVDLGLAKRHGQRVVFARDLLANLRRRDIDAAARTLARETGLTYREAVEAGRVIGVYRRSVELASGRFAMLDDGVGFSLVPWKPVIESRLGQCISAVIRGTGVSWEFGRQRGPGVT